MSLHELMVDELRDLYNAEKQLTRALPKLARAASYAELRDLIEAHLDETQTQVSRLEQVFELLDERAQGKHCAGMAGIIEEGGDLVGEGYEGAVLDAGIIAAAQRAEHYEIGAYGTVIAWADELGLQEVSTLLRDTLKEEKSADEKLTQIAESQINQAATTEAEGAEEAEPIEGGRTSGAGARRGTSQRSTGGRARGRR